MFSNQHPYRPAIFLYQRAPLALSLATVLHWKRKALCLDYDKEFPSILAAAPKWRLTKAFSEKAELICVACWLKCMHWNSNRAPSEWIYLFNFICKCKCSSVRQIELPGSSRKCLSNLHCWAWINCSCELPWQPITLCYDQYRSCHTMINSNFRRLS